jgi:hypothetical protein
MLELLQTFNYNKKHVKSSKEKWKGWQYTQKLKLLKF